MSRTARIGLVAGGGLAAGLAWQRISPSACPYALRWLIEIPRPGLSPARLEQILLPVAGERVLEVGPGTGTFALPMAERVAPQGTLLALDLQHKMLEALSERAAREGIENLEPVQGDATALPYEDDSIDAAFLVTVLGEVPDQDGALHELRRVLRPGGRVVFGETVLDPHLVTLSALKRRAEAAGLRFEQTLGVAPLGFFARFAVA